jgi:hypothetical protein
MKEPSMKRMVGLTAALVLATALPMHAGPARDLKPGAPQQQKPDQKNAEEPSVAGKWTLSVDDPRSEMTFGLTLKLDGNKVTGTCSNDQLGDLPLTGEYKDGRLSFAVSFEAGGNSGSLEFTAKLKDKDTLVGNMSSRKGDLAWTATRAKAPALAALIW